MIRSSAAELVFDRKKLPLQCVIKTPSALPGESQATTDLPTLLDEFGYHSCTFCLVDHRPPKPNSILYATNVSADWIEGYWQRGYAMVDPTSLKAQQSMEPIIWSNCKPINSLERSLQAYGESTGTANGLSVPLHSPNGATFIGKFGARTRTLDSDAVPMLWLITNLARQTLLDANHAFRSADRFKAASHKNIEKLSTRELECLQCTGRGLTTKQVGVQLDLSGNTVHGYLTSAMRKLGVTNRVAAVVKAFTLGLIEI